MELMIDDKRIVDERKEKGNGRRIFFYVALKACEEGTRRRRLRLRLLDVRKEGVLYCAVLCSTKPLNRFKVTPSFSSLAFVYHHHHHHHHQPAPSSSSSSSNIHFANKRLLLLPYDRSLSLAALIKSISFCFFLSFILHPLHPLSLRTLSTCKPFCFNLHSRLF